MVIGVIVIFVLMALVEGMIGIWLVIQHGWGSPAWVGGMLHLLAGKLTGLLAMGFVLIFLRE